MQASPTIAESLETRVAELELLLKDAQRDQDPAHQFIVMCGGFPIAFTETGVDEVQPRVDSYENVSRMRFLRARELARVTRNGAGQYGEVKQYVMALESAIREVRSMLKKLKP